MNAYGQTTDPNSGFLRELGGRGTTGSIRTAGVEIGWQEPSQSVTEFTPCVVAAPFRPKAKGGNAADKQRFTTSPRPKTSLTLSFPNATTLHANPPCTQAGG